MSGGWLPPQPPERPPAGPERPPVFTPPPGPGGSNGLAIAALVCAIASLVLLLFSLGLSFVFSLPLAAVAWVCAARARSDVQPGQRRAGLILAVVAVALSTIAAVVWIVLISSGFSVEELQENLERELERQRQRDRARA